MQKSTDFTSPVMEVIQKRRSSRAYADKSVEKEKIHSLFEAARWAPSSLNEQPWFYIYATRDQELWSKIFEAVKEGNKIWAKNAPLLICSLARKNYIRFEHPNPAAQYDLGAANAFLSLQAAHLGLNVHQMAGFDSQIIIKNLGVPDEFEPFIVMAIGYPGDVEKLPENLKAREFAPRERYIEEEFVRNMAFNE